MILDYSDEIKKLIEKILYFEKNLDIDSNKRELSKLQKEANKPNFWDDSEKAQQAMQRLAVLRQEVELWRSLATRVADSLELLELISLEGDEAMLPEVAQEVDSLEKELVRHEFLLLLSGPHDKADAILAIHAGAGGTDAQDWAEMLLRMYLRWAEARGHAAEVVDRLPGEEAGIKRAMVTISGSYAYGYLRAERGVHRLVRPATMWSLTGPASSGKRSAAS